MPSGEYASAGVGGALKLKGGGRVEKKPHKSKHKHKHKKRKEGGDRLLEARDGREATEDGKRAEEAKKKDIADGSDGGDDGNDGDGDDDPYARMTPAERRFAEAQEKKIRDLMLASPEEVRSAHPELLKSHKERLADMNAYLSRMSEHNDLPKIGPG